MNPDSTVLSNQRLDPYTMMAAMTAARTPAGAMTAAPAVTGGDWVGALVGTPVPVGCEGVVALPVGTTVEPVAEPVAVGVAEPVAEGVAEPEAEPVAEAEPEAEEEPPPVESLQLASEKSS